MGRSLVNPDLSNRPEKEKESTSGFRKQINGVRDKRPNNQKVSVGTAHKGQGN